MIEELRIYDLLGRYSISSAGFQLDTCKNLRPKFVCAALALLDKACRKGKKERGRCLPKDPINESSEVLGNLASMGYTEKCVLENKAERKGT